MEEMRDLLANHRPKRTHTYRVSRAVADANYADQLRSGYELREMNEDEIKEMAEFLEMDFEEFQGGLVRKPYVSKQQCLKCERLLNFTDLINQAVHSKTHTKRFMREVLLGKRGDFITVPGTEEDDHVSRCLNCGDMSMLWSGHTGYSVCSGGGGYAWCAW